MLPYDDDLLTDGGVYDNLGVSHFDTTESSKDFDGMIILSDAGASFKWDLKERFGWLVSRTGRTIDIMMRRLGDKDTKGVENYYKEKIVRLSIRDILDKKGDVARLPPEYRPHLKNLRTDLDSFSALEVQSLVMHGSDVANNRLPKHSGPSRNQNAVELPELANIISLEAGARRKVGLFSGDDIILSIMMLVFISIVPLAALISVVGSPIVFVGNIDLLRKQEALTTREDALLNVLKPGPQALTSEYISAFRLHFSRLNLRKFDPERLLELGTKADELIASGENPLNSYPPLELLSNIDPVAKVLDEYIALTGNDVKVISAYRTTKYNSLIGGSKNSSHVLFYAADFVASSGRPPEWAAVMRQIRSRGVFQGGIGAYAGFVHVDGRGVNRDFGQE